MSNASESLARKSVPELDRVLGHSWSVLDDGFIRVVDYLGSDEAIVQAARVSYGTGTKAVHEDRGLIRYLMRHSHTTPFEMCEIKLHIRAPMDTWRQWIRHRTANVNEYSTRYSVAIDSAATTSPDQWRLQSTASKQGSAGRIDAETGRLLSEAEGTLLAQARKTYEDRLSAGVAREQARKDLPLSTYTEAYWKTDLHNLLHFLKLRMDSHAQYEIRAYADVLGNEIVKRWCPIAWEAFRQYQLNALILSELETEIVKHLASSHPELARERAASFGWLTEGPDGGLRPNRERSEAEAKLERLGFNSPWH